MTTGESFDVGEYALYWSDADDAWVCPSCCSRAQDGKPSILSCLECLTGEMFDRYGGLSMEHPSSSHFA